MTEDKKSEGRETPDKDQPGEDIAQVQDIPEPETNDVPVTNEVRTTIRDTTYIPQSKALFNK